MPLLLLATPIVSTLIGGALAVRFRGCVTLLTALGAGMLLGATFLDLLPEALAIGPSANLSSTRILALTLLSFLAFYCIQGGLDALGKKTPRNRVTSWVVRRAGAGMLIFHSFRDGMAIGAAYVASHHAGYAVALGIAAHDLGDGMNTVLLTSNSGASAWSICLFLLADAFAPLLGGLLTAWWVPSQRAAVALLVLAAGFFLQMATGDFLPEVRRFKGSYERILLPSVFFGVAVIYGANLLLGN